tara:strand:+ start:6829 stop:7656 length:828 start_codon:yes stop_codon:yes gene_type:complete
MKTNLNLVFGASGLIGESFKKTVKRKQNYIFLSKNNNKFYKIDLNKSLKKFPYKKVDTCFFFASPRIKKKNFKREKFFQEFNWLKNVIFNIKINKLIYLSSSSIYYDKNHFIGSNKRKCEHLIIKNKKKFKYHQIWRPFNLVGSKHHNSDHFHNLLYKKMFIENKRKYTFNGHLGDQRAYSDVTSFVKKLQLESKKNISFIKDYGNLNLIKIEDIIKLFNKSYLNINSFNFKYKFLNKKPNKNKVKLNKINICMRLSSINIFKNYLKKSLHAKKV